MVFDAKCKSKARLDGKTAVITGCNTGIGKETARDLYKRGARVIMACRNVEKTEQAASDIVKQCQGMENVGTLLILKLDLSSLKSVRECAEKLMENETRIDILVNNAGLFCAKSKTEDGFETQFATNHLGHFLLTLLLLPKLVKSAPARIVNVASIAHIMLKGDIDFDDLDWERRKYTPWQSYCQSKLCNILFTKELAIRLKDANIEGVTTYAVHPGGVATDIQRDIDTIFSTVADMLAKMVRPFLKTPKQGAQTTIHCAVDEKAGNQTGLYYAECKPTSTNKNAKKVDDAKRLWEVSLKMVGFKEDHNPFV